MRLLVGLGNPGPRYRDTRHNAGYLVLDELARRFGVRFRASATSDTARHGRLVLVKPRTFMNLSGQAVQGELTRARAHPDELLVIHDDLDLPLGRLRFKQGGGSGGQKGVADIQRHLGPAFLRLKLGIDRPPAGWSTEHWVLSRFRPEESALLERVVRAAADAVEVLLSAGVEEAMNRANGVDLSTPPGEQREPGEG